MELAVIRFREIVQELQNEIQSWEHRYRKSENQSQSMINHVHTVMELNNKLQSSLNSSKNREITFELEKLQSQQALDKLAIWHYFLSAAESPVVTFGNEVERLVSAHLTLKRSASLLRIISSVLLDEDLIHIPTTTVLYKLSALCFLLSTLLEWETVMEVDFPCQEAMAVDKTCNSCIDLLQQSMLTEHNLKICQVYVDTFSDFIKIHAPQLESFLIFHSIATHVHLATLLYNQAGSNSASLAKLRNWIDAQKFDGWSVATLKTVFSNINLTEVDVLMHEAVQSARNGLFIDENFVLAFSKLSTIDLSLPEQKDPELPRWATLGNTRPIIIQENPDISTLKSTLTQKNKLIETLEVKIKHYISKTKRFAEKEEVIMQLRTNIQEAKKKEAFLQQTITDLRANLEQKSREAKQFRAHVQTRLKMSSIKSEDIVNMHLDSLQVSKLETQVSSLRATIHHLVLQNQESDLEWLDVLGSISQPPVSILPHVELAFEKLQKLSKSVRLGCISTSSQWRSKSDIPRHLAQCQELAWSRYVADLAVANT